MLGFESRPASGGELAPNRLVAQAFTRNWKKRDEKGVALKRLILCLISGSLLLSLGCAKKESLVIAQVGDRKITVGDFEKASETMDAKYLPKTNDLVGKKELLDVMINKDVMAIKALAAGYEKDQWFVKFFTRYKGQYLVAALQNQYVIKKVQNVTDEQVNNYWKLMHYEYNLSEIVVPDEGQAASLREQILAGADFAEMAKRYSQGPEARDGGYLGTGQIGTMLWWIEDALANMKAGEVSKPLQTPTGWALLKVASVKEITPERDIKWARQRVIAIKQKQEAEALKHKIEKDIGLFINPEAVDIVYNNLPPDIPFDDIVNYRVTRDNAPKLEVPEQYQGMEMAKYDGGSYTIKDYMTYYEQMGLPDRPRHQYGKESVIESIHKKIFDEALPAYCEQKLKLLDIPEVRNGLEKKREEFLVQMLFDDQVRGKVDVPQKDVEDYYNAHKSELIAPEKRDYSILIVGDKSKAEEVAGFAKKGQDFAQLVKKYSEDTQSAQNGGRTGLVARGRYMDYDPEAFSMPEGTVSDPFRVPRGLAIIKVWKVEAGKTMPYADAANDIRNALMETKADKLLAEKFVEWRKDYPIKVFENNLKKARLKKTAPPEVAPADTTKK